MEVIVIKLPNTEQADSFQGATVVRKVDIDRLAREAAEVAQREVPAKQVVLITIKQGAYLAVPLGSPFPAADGDVATEDGLSQETVRSRVLAFFGKDAYIESDVWIRAISLANGGTRAVLEMAKDPLTSPDPKINGKFPIRIRG
jgi:hypothetical protein